MATAHHFQKGDRLRHTARPEWGDGRVLAVEVIRVNGNTTQRLTIDFAHKGKTTLNTAFATVEPVNGNAAATGRVTAAHEAQAMVSPDAELDAQGWLASLAGKKPTDVLLELPDACSDPFASLARRLDATLDQYRHEKTPRGLLDWAIAQTGLHDPYTVFSRHDLETFFDGYAHARDLHLIDLVRTIKRENQRQVLDAAQNHKVPAARTALGKAIRR